MYIYNVTTKVNWGICDEWLKWMREEHLQEVVNTGCFYKSTLLRILETDEEEGPTFAAQYYATEKKDYLLYLEQFAPLLRQKAVLKWGDNIISFRSVMETVFESDR